MKSPRAQTLLERKGARRPDAKTSIAWKKQRRASQGSDDDGAGSLGAVPSGGTLLTHWLCWLAMIREMDWFAGEWAGPFHWEADQQEATELRDSCTHCTARVNNCCSRAAAWVCGCYAPWRAAVCCKENRPVKGNPCRKNPKREARSSRTSKLAGAS